MVNLSNLKKYLYLWVVERTIPGFLLRPFRPYKKPRIEVNHTKNKFDRGVFCLSIDFEMGWGMAPYVRSYARLERNNFPLILDVLDKYEVPATWGVVGKIYEDVAKPNEQDDYLQGERNYIDRFKGRKVMHELATHTYDHTDFSIATNEEVETQLKKILKFNVDTIIFPSNHIAHLDKLLNYGIWIYRGSEPIIQYPTKKYGLWNITQTYQLAGRAWESRILVHAIQMINKAIEEGLVCHLWFHVFEMDEIMIKKVLEPLLFYAHEARRNDKLAILTMKQIVEECKKK